ncbi:DUF6314 family protein [Mesorhizobium sp. PAMC28654]|uniref:DUF6314 family protein n=1 Tax=Mesorhizobium sp. PAMC28654 TaxID=2880934 RepID=UPI001D0BBE93|nr:DUF6314 family protein [Mesorhizobium sp. PAMC28654]UDL89108.1 DUF6314 family protein [Mesorhizobium sp. PAMC28654]
MNDGPVTGDAPAWHADVLLGSWQVRRTVIDFRAGTSCAFSGQAVVTADGFAESGEVRLGERALSASRSYRLERRGDVLAVLRADGSDFISLDGRASQSVRHDCGADLYAGRFFFRGPHEWTEAWRVKGPRKNYASLGRFVRL